MQDNAIQDKIRDVLKDPPEEWQRKVNQFAATDAGKLTLGTLGVWALWRLALPSKQNQIPDITERHASNT